MEESGEDLFAKLFTPEFWSEQLKNLADIATAVILKLIFALIVLLIGWIIIKIILWIIRKIMTKSGTEEVIINFVISVIKFFLWMMLIMMILDIVEIQLVSMAAIIAALAFAIGLAMGDFMNNLIAGVVILAYKHIAVGEFITGAGVTGTIKEITMTRTIIHTVDNRVCIVPNEPLAMGVVENFSREKNRRVDLTIGVGYEADLNKARKVLANVCKKHPLVLSEPTTVVAVHELADSSVNFVVRPWCKGADYWTTYFEVTEQCKVALDKAGISIPFPQIDAHIIKEGAGEGAPQGRAIPGEDSDADGTADEDEYEYEDDDDSDDDDDDEDEYEYEYETESETPPPAKKSKKSRK